MLLKPWGLIFGNQNNGVRKSGAVYFDSFSAPAKLKFSSRASTNCFLHLSIRARNIFRAHSARYTFSNFSKELQKWNP